ncbi:hypothetical protein C8F01DRAFT_1134703 [Mycena amicta]|nr:hypothetical protein C8F01DRAFT_1134703 [Mycena amicta]
MRTLSLVVLTTALLLAQAVFAVPIDAHVDCFRKKRQSTATSEMIQAQAAVQLAYQAAGGGRGGGGCGGQLGSGRC